MREWSRETQKSKPKHMNKNEIKVSYINRSLENFILSGLKLDKQI